MLEIAGLAKRFGGFLAVNSVSFAVKPGEILGLIGPNGSGKTTIFNLIAGTLPPSAGSIRFSVVRLHATVQTQTILMPLSCSQRHAGQLTTN